MNKNMKIAAFFAAIFAVVFSAVSCRENYGDPDSFLDVPENDIKVDYSGKNHLGEIPYVEVGSNVPWKITAIPDWMEASLLSSDRGRRNVFLTCEENTTGADREGLVTFSGAGMEKSVKLIQTLKIEVLELSDTEIEVKGSGKLSTGQTPSFYILDVNSDWTITSDSWITPSVTSGPAGQYITVSLSIAENDSGAARPGKVTVKAGSKQAVVTVKQSVDGIETSVSAITLNKSGKRDGNDSPVTFTLSAQSAWTASAPSWITVSPSNGDGGEIAQTITLSVDENTDGRLRTGKIVFSLSSGVSTSVDVIQSSTMYEDDNLLFQDDFSWLDHYIEEYNKSNDGKTVGDAVGTGDEAANAVGVYPKYTGIIEELETRGYKDLRYVPGSYQCLYFMDAYFKFGKTDCHTGFRLPAVDCAGAVNVDLSFDWCAQMTGSGNVDKLTLTVEVANGGGTVVSPAMPISHDQVKGELKWQRVTVRIEGLTSASEVNIRPTEMYLGKDEQPDQQRWYLDNVKITKAN